MNSQRMRQFEAKLRPLTWLGFINMVALFASLFLGPKGNINPYFVLFALLSAVITTIRNVKMYGLMDEYERSLMLRAVAVAFIFLMVSVFVTGMVAAISPAEAVSPLLLMVLFLLSFGVMGIAQNVMQRRESHE